MSDIPRVVFPDYKRKLPVAMTQKGKRPSDVADKLENAEPTEPRDPAGYDEDEIRQVA
jgi:hypothetical protein